MVLAIISADEGGGSGVVEDLFGLRIESQRAADARVAKVRIED
jgi:hypothetical protein